MTRSVFLMTAVIRFYVLLFLLNYFLIEFKAVYYTN